MPGQSKPSAAAHKARQKARRKLRLLSQRDVLLRSIQLPDGAAVGDGFRCVALSAQSEIDWAAVPKALRPNPNGEQGAREQRKMLQIQTFHDILVGVGASAAARRVVDFGCGSGGVSLCLAALFPRCTFLLVDPFERSIALAKKQAKSAGLSNVEFQVCKAEAFRADDPFEFEVGLSLKACADEPDHVQRLCVARGAAFVIWPCCTGTCGACAGGAEHAVARPSSQWLAQQLGTDAVAAVVAPAQAAPAAPGSGSAAPPVPPSGDGGGHLSPVAAAFDLLASGCDHSAVDAAGAVAAVVASCVGEAAPTEDAGAGAGAGTGEGAGPLEMGEQEAAVLALQCRERCAAVLAVDRAQRAAEAAGGDGGGGGGYNVSVLAVSTAAAGPESQAPGQSQAAASGTCSQEAAAAGSAGGAADVPAARCELLLCGLPPSTGPAVAAGSETEAGFAALAVRPQTLLWTTRDSAPPLRAPQQPAAKVLQKKQKKTQMLAREAQAEAGAAKEAASADKAAPGLGEVAKGWVVRDVGAAQDAATEAASHSVAGAADAAEPPRCSYFMKRQQRSCRNFAAAGLGLCVNHTPAALEAQRVRSEEQKAAREDGAGAGAGDGAGVPKAPKKRPARISATQKRMANPFAQQYQIPAEALAPDSLFADPQLPIHIDVGCAKGRLMQQLAQQQMQPGQPPGQPGPGTVGPLMNFVGVEIREDLVEAANAWRDAQAPPPRNLHFVATNINVSLRPLLSQFLPSPRCIGCVSVQFPDPWHRARHRRRRIVQTRLVRQIARLLRLDGYAYVSSDRLDVAEDMVERFRAHGDFAPMRALGQARDAWAAKAAGAGVGAGAGADASGMWEVDAQGWLLRNPIGVSARVFYCPLSRAV
jgi:tRNA (guanine-N7-)-methyltransferase